MADYPEYTILSMYLTLGIPLLFSYYLLSTRSNKVLNNFWSNHGRIKWLKKYDSVARKTFAVSMIVAAIAGVYLLYYFTWGNNGNGATDSKIFGIEYEQGGKYFIYVGFLLLLGFSLLWIPTFRLADNLSTLVLFIAGAGAVVIMAALASTDLQTDEDKAALAAAVYVAFHTCILDGLLWTGTVPLKI